MDNTFQEDCGFEGVLKTAVSVSLFRLWGIIFFSFTLLKAGQLKQRSTCYDSVELSEVIELYP